MERLWQRKQRHPAWNVWARLGCGENVVYPLVERLDDPDDIVRLDSTRTVWNPWGVGQLVFEVSGHFAERQQRTRDRPPAADSLNPGLSRIIRMTCSASSTRLGISLCLLKDNWVIGRACKARSLPASRLAHRNCQARRTDCRWRRNYRCMTYGLRGREQHQRAPREIRVGSRPGRGPRRHATSILLGPTSWISRNWRAQCRIDRQPVLAADHR